MKIICDWIKPIKKIMRREDRLRRQFEEAGDEIGIAMLDAMVCARMRGYGRRIQGLAVSATLAFVAGKSMVRWQWEMKRDWMIRYPTLKEIEELKRAELLPWCERMRKAG